MEKRLASIEKDLILKDFEERRRIQALILGKGVLTFRMIGRSVGKGSYIIRSAYYYPEDHDSKPWFQKVSPLLEQRRNLRAQLNDLSVKSIASKFQVSIDAVKRVQENAKR